MDFTGTVDEVRSSGSRGSVRTLSISAKGMDTTSKPNGNGGGRLDHGSSGIGPLRGIHRHPTAALHGADDLAGTIRRNAGRAIEA